MTPSTAAMAPIVNRFEISISRRTLAKARAAPGSNGGGSGGVTAVACGPVALAADATGSGAAWGGGADCATAAGDGATGPGVARGAAVGAGSGVDQGTAGGRGSGE